MSAYYLWIPFLPTFYFNFTKFTRLLGKYFLENNIIKNSLGGQYDPAVICQNFLNIRRRYTKHHIYFGLYKLLFHKLLTDTHRLNKFFRYGQEALNYIWSVKHIGPEGKYLSHDLRCELFPTEVA